MEGAILLIVVGTTIWVGFDSSSRDWEGTNSSTLGWVVCCLLVWIVAFPFYLSKRGAAPLKGVAPPPPSLPPAGWYVDPQHAAQMRWWDGQRWTEHLHGGQP